jgi:NADH-quinone oxidoreductase subunit L
VAGYEVAPEERRFEVTVASWLPELPMVGDAGPASRGGSLRADYGFQLDPLSAIMILVVTGVGLLIHIY